MTTFGSQAQALASRRVYQIQSATNAFNEAMGEGEHADSTFRFIARAWPDGKQARFKFTYFVALVSQETRAGHP